MNFLAFNRLHGMRDFKGFSFNRTCQLGVDFTIIDRHNFRFQNDQDGERRRNSTESTQSINLAGVNS